MSLTIEQGILLLETALPVLKGEHRTTLKIIQAVPADKGDYRPHENSKSAFDLAWHIASAENMFLEAVLDGAFDFTRQRPDFIKTSADVAPWYSERFALNFGRLRKLAGPEVIRMVDFRGMIQWEAVKFLDLAIRHSVHHRGQLSTYLRPMGAKVPSIYGESYDDAQARKAATP